MTGSGASPSGVSRSSRPIQTVMLATDLSTASEGAAARAMEAALAFRARLLIVNVLETRRLNGLGVHARVDQARAEREEALEALVGRARAQVLRCEYILWSGEASTSIVAVADPERADLIIVGTHGRDRAGRLLLGSVSDHLVRSAPCPVMVVRPD